MQKYIQWEIGRFFLNIFEITHINLYSVTKNRNSQVMLTQPYVHEGGHRGADGKQQEQGLSFIKV